MRKIASLSLICVALAGCASTGPVTSDSSVPAAQPEVLEIFMVPVEELQARSVTVVSADAGALARGSSRYCRSRRLPGSRIFGEECYVTSAAEDELNDRYIQSEIEEVRRINDLATMQSIQDRVESGDFGTTPSTPVN